MKTVFVSGRFNVLHPGHIRLFKFAKECGDKLIVAVESDELAGRGAHISEEMRLEGVLCNESVDEAFLTNQPVEALIEKIRPDMIVKGREHEDRFNPELQAISKYGGELLFSSGESVFSSIDLIHREFQELIHNTIHLPNDYMIRNLIDRGRVIKLIEKFHQLKVVVLGDLIVDEYISCQPLGMSQEDPTIVVSPIDSSMFVGGAGIVAAHASGLGAEVNFFSISGNDTSREFALEKLKASGVAADMLIDHARPTTLKQRYRSKGKSLLRVSHLHQEAISTDLQSILIEKIEKIMGDTDLLVFSDFNYGCLPQQLVDTIIEMAKEQGVMLAADSQSSSQVGDIARFKGMDLITPTEREARVSTRNKEDGLVVLAERLRTDANASHVLLKLGEEGVLVQTGTEDGEDIHTDQVPALNSSARDVAGAGDSMLIAAAMAMTVGANLWEMGLVGSTAAAIQVGRVGNVPLSAHELIEEFSL